MSQLKRIQNNFFEAQQLLSEFVNDKDNLKKIDKAANIMTAALKKGKKIIVCGNGGSMCDAMHFAEEMQGRFRMNRKPLAAIAISDASYITCTANDFGYDEVFSRSVQAIGNVGDILLAISTSGNSPNIINAAVEAKKRKMTVIALTGKGGGKLASLCNLELRTPQSQYADRVQEIHIKIIHSLIHAIEGNLKLS